MTDRSKLLALADAVEKLTGPDRRTDYLIMTATVRSGKGYLWDPEDGNYRYTASLDAAMTLVPKGWAIDRLSSWPASPEGADNVTAPQSRVSLAGTSIERFGRRMIWGHGGKDGKVEANSATPSLALTAACLRARAQAEALA